MSDVAIYVNNLYKCFKIYQNPRHRIMEWMSFGKAVKHKQFWALKGISFEVSRGTCLGIIGPNGAGKSTLLKILTRALYPTSGDFSLKGNVMSLLELGTGFKNELTGRQNLFNSSRILGFSDKYVKGRIKDIQEFSELGDFFDRPLKTYSTGMRVRLAFSMFVYMKPEILIIDEALSVGDVFFQHKSFEKIREIVSSGTTCLFVSHDLRAVQNVCSRAIFLKNGQTVFMGDPVEVVSRYLTSVRKRRNDAGMPPKGEKKEVPARNQEDVLMDPEEIKAHDILGKARSRHGIRSLEMVAACIQDKNGAFTMNVGMFEPITFHILLRAHEHIINPSTGIRLTDRLGNIVFAAGTWNLGHRLPDMSAGQELIVRLDIDLNISGGEYVFTLGCSEPAPADQGPNAGVSLDRFEMLGPIVVRANYAGIAPFYGIAQLPMRARNQLVKKPGITSRL